MGATKIIPVFEKGGILPIMLGQAQIDEHGTVTFYVSRDDEIVSYEEVFFEDGTTSHFEVSFKKGLRRTMIMYGNDQQ
jgi:hypothetical protein